MQLRNQYLDDVYVSTDSEEIAKVSRKYGAKVIKRPANFATDKASSELALLHFAKKVDCEVIMLLQCTSPLTSTHYIDFMIETYCRNGNDTMLSVCKAEGGFQCGGFLWSSKAKPINHKLPRQRRQDLQEEFKENGAMYMMTKEGLLKHKSRFFGKIGLFEMSKIKSFEIDSFTDLYFIERLMKAKIYDEEYNFMWGY